MGPTANGQPFSKWPNTHNIVPLALASVYLNLRYHTPQTNTDKKLCDMRLRIFFQSVNICCVVVVDGDFFCCCCCCCARFRWPFLCRCFSVLWLLSAWFTACVVRLLLLLLLFLVYYTFISQANLVCALRPNVHDVVCLAATPSNIAQCLVNLAVRNWHTQYQTGEYYACLYLIQACSQIQMKQ